MIIPMRGQRSDMREAVSGGSPKRSQAVPFVAKEICQRRQLVGVSILLL